MDMREVFTIDGRRFSNMAGFYDEVEQVFMPRSPSGLKSAEMNQSIWNAPIRTRTPRNQLQIPPMFKAHWSGRL